MTLPQRFMDKVSEDPESGCWLWTAGVEPNGYARYRHPYSQYAHRSAWFEKFGPVPDGTELDHICRVRHCVNPDHLEPVTRLVNQLRGATFVATNAAKTHCPQGHEYTPENTRIKPSEGRRRCRICLAEQTRRRRASKRT